MYVCMYVCKLLFRVVNSKQPNTFMEVILAVKNTTLVVVKIRPEKIQAYTVFESMTSAIPEQALQLR